MVQIAQAYPGREDKTAFSKYTRNNDVIKA